MSSIRRRSAPVALAVAPLLALTACGGGGEEDTNADAPAITEPSPITGDSGGQAAQGQARNPADDVQLDLMLAGVRARDVNLDDEREEFVEFCFGASIQEITDQSGFQLAGLAPSNRVASTEARLVETDDRCVLASFPADTDVRSYTIGTVGNVVVEDRSGEVNIQDSLALSGGGDSRGVGGTNAPELVRVSVDPTLDQISYIFDESELAEQGAQASSFGYYTSDGSAVTAGSIESVDDDTVIVSFGEGGAQQVEEAVRFFAEAGAVQDRQGSASTLGAAGDATAVPDLVSVKRAAGEGGQYDFRFDEAVQREQADRFILYTSDGQELTASSVTRPSPEIVRATFSEAMDFSGKIARAAVHSDAVVSLNSGARGNTIGAASLAGGDAGGPTSGPDLMGVTLDAETGQATFTFDATLEEDGVQAGSFFLITDSGSVSAGRDVVNVTGEGGVTGNEVVVLFDEAIAQAAVNASVNGQAVTDQSGEQNPAITVEVS
jgi:hypothetical protein